MGGLDVQMIHPSAAPELRLLDRDDTEEGWGQVAWTAPEGWSLNKVLTDEGVLEQGRACSQCVLNSQPIASTELSCWMQAGAHVSGWTVPELGLRDEQEAEEGYVGAFPEHGCRR